jgi:pyruvate dehydrogenase E2 component (dihydrolipoamide acetyltransferase)
MSEEIKMPQMGESIAEGTIVRWLKQVGDQVKRDEPLFEISTDKVDAEIPSPAAGVLSEIKVNEGETVPVNTVVAVINGAGAKPAQAAHPAKEAEPEASESNPAPAAEPAAQAKPEPSQEARHAHVSPPPEEPKGAAQPEAREAAPQRTESARGSEETASEDERRVRSSPLVRRIAKEHGVDVSQIEGTGIGGRVTKNDILSYVENRTQAAPPAPARTAPAAEAAAATSEPASARVERASVEERPAAAPTSPPRAPQPLKAPSTEAAAVGPPPFSDGDRYTIEPMTVMRRRIAERMVESRHISAHVTTFMEIDFTETARVRDKLKGEYLSRDGVRLTFMPFIVKGVIEGIKKWPIVNSAVWGDQIVYKQDINIGIAVALDWGLIVPVARNADEKSLLGLARAINDLGERARSKQLKPDEVQGGTFTITNPGGFGSLVGTPIINQPQVAILGVGVIKKRPVVINDAIAIRQICYFGLSFDHRIIDGAVADQFLATVRDTIEAANYTS